ncbi:mCG1031067, isoform CRA_b [Mus musculus]|nr:mCG1031067, isoform CRA_b [Mus musculus]EDL14100.1 mCG1031067, isoform CRA_b [Mus musculus]
MEEYGLLAHLCVLACLYIPEPLTQGMMAPISSRCSTWLLQLPCLLPATSTLSWNCKPK